MCLRAVPMQVQKPINVIKLDQTTSVGENLSTTTTPTPTPGLNFWCLDLDPPGQNSVWCVPWLLTTLGGFLNSPQKTYATKCILFISTNAKCQTKCQSGRLTSESFLDSVCLNSLHLLAVQNHPWSLPESWTLGCTCNLTMRESILADRCCLIKLDYVNWFLDLHCWNPGRRVIGKYPSPNWTLCAEIFSPFHWQWRVVRYSVSGTCNTRGRYWRIRR